MISLFLGAFMALFSVINPLGTVPIFVGLTKNQNTKAKSTVALWVAINVLIILLISFFAGKYILLFFGISLNSLKLAGGLIIASSGFALLSGNFSKHKGMDKKVKEDAFNRSEVSLTPLAMPMLAGPGTISLLIAYQQEHDLFVETVSIIAAVVAVSMVIFIILRSSTLIVNFLGASGINALSRIIGFIVIAIGIEYVVSTLQLIVEKYL